MPRYLYECAECGARYDVNHSIKIKYKSCDEIESNTKDCSGELVRIPSFSYVIKKTENKKNVGEATKEFIKDATEELKEQKRKLKGQVHK